MSEIIEPTEPQEIQPGPLPQMAVDCILAAIKEGDIPFVDSKNVVIDKPPRSDWNGKEYIVISEDVSKGGSYQLGIGPVKTPLAIRTWAETREGAARLCKEATEAVRIGLFRLMRRGFGIHGVYIDPNLTEGKKNAKYFGGPRDENVAVRLLIVINTINS